MEIFIDVFLTPHIGTKIAKSNIPSNLEDNSKIKTPDFMYMEKLPTITFPKFISGKIWISAIYRIIESGVKL